MNVSLESLVRTNILQLSPYSSARDESPDWMPEQRVMLDANENNLGGPLDPVLARYPGNLRNQLTAQVAQWKGLETSQVFLGNGSDEAIDLLLRAFAEPGRDNVIQMPPTYGMYAVQAKIQGAEVRNAPLNPDFRPNPKAVAAVTDQHSKILFLCSPNNPTGASLPESFITEILETFPGLVVVDEAYQDFSKEKSWLSRIPAYPNLVVLQTFSKAWGLAGIRLGMAFAHPFVVRQLNNIRYPYNINSLTIQHALSALKQKEEVAQQVAQIREEREKLAEALKTLPTVLEVYPSDANFLLIRVKDADSLYRQLALQGILVRNRHKELHCSQCLRITIGKPSENQQLLAALHQFDIHS
ncbi:MAG: histidinol-phosphate transaminase [Saprospiraceae bacterium]|nr:histidinol-phosphate transaminase [Saprospiraceae bacterium]